MSRILILLIFLCLFSCNRKNDSKHLYFQLETSEKDLEETVKAQDQYIYFHSEGNKFLIKRYDSLSKIASGIKNTSNVIGFENREKILTIRDSINTEYKLNLNFMPYDTYENVEDSIFKKTVNTDFLRLTKKFQDKYMFPPIEM